MAAVRSTLHILPSRFERLVYIASLQDPESRGQLSHLLPPDFDRQEVDLALRREHHKAFEDWLGLALEDKLVDLKAYASGRGETVADVAYQRLRPDGRGGLVPRTALSPEKQFFDSDLEILLMILDPKNDSIVVTRGPRQVMGDRSGVEKTVPLIAVVDDDESIRAAMGGLIRSVGYRSMTFESGAELLASKGTQEIDCLIIDIDMPGMNGLELQRRLIEMKYAIPIIFVTGHDGDLREKVLKQRPVAVLRKTCRVEDLLSAIQSAMQSSGR